MNHAPYIILFSGVNAVFSAADILHQSDLSGPHHRPLS